MIICTTKIKCKVFNNTTIFRRHVGYINPNVTFTAYSRSGQWLQFAGGWVSAGANQQYVEWHEEVPISENPANLDAALSVGKFATLTTDNFSKKWGYKPRRPGKLASYPQTSTFNTIPAIGKGKRLPLTLKVLSKTLSLNGINTFRLYIPSTGWINNDGETPIVDKISPTSERLSWAANHVLVLETRGMFSRVYADDCNSDLIHTFFSKNGRLVTHKFNAINKNGNMIKYGKGYDLYTPFTSDGDMWCPTEELEMWPELPFQLADGTSIVQYELNGFNYYGIRADGSKVLLRDKYGFKTNWSLKNPEVPV